MLFNEFPREIGPPRKTVYNKKEFLSYINLHNGKKKAIYTSIYSFENIFSETNKKPDYNSATIDKIYFDFDDKSCMAWQECMKLHKDLVKEDTKHCIVMSGRGYHLYVFCKVCSLAYKKETIKGAQNYFIHRLKLTVDPQVIGNPAQMARVPNTYHPKAERFCIPLSKWQFRGGDDYAKEIAKKQNFETKVLIGRKLLSIKKFDVAKKEEYWPGADFVKQDQYGGITLDKKSISPLIRRLLSNENAGWSDRYFIILYLKEKGYGVKEVYSILEEHLSRKKLNHCVKEEKQLQYLFSRNDLLFPSFESLHKQGVCKDKEEYGEEVYK